MIPITKFKLKNEIINVRLQPKALILNYNGGFKSLEQTNNVCNGVAEYLNKHNLSISAIDGELVFIENKNGLLVRLYNKIFKK